MSRIVILIFALTGCTAQDKVLLRWSSTSDKVYNYEVLIDAYPEQLKLTANGYEPSEQSVFDSKLVGQLKGIPLPEHMPLLASVRSKSKDVFEVSVVRAEPVFEGEPKNGEEKLERELQKKMAGTLQLLSDMNASGDVLSFYLVQKQKNLISLFFKLPNRPINVGDEWKVPVNLVELGNGYIVENARRYNRATLMSLYSEPKLGRVAQIMYVINEDLNGKYQLKPNTDQTAPTFNIKASYIAFGEFVVEQGYWNHYIGLMSYSGGGALPVNSKKLHALRYVK